MDNLQHIDNLLKKAAQVPANALVSDSDWNAVEKKLKNRKNRIFAMWFFLALMLVSGAGLLVSNYSSTENTVVSNKDINEKSADPINLDEQPILNPISESESSVMELVEKIESKKKVVTEPDYSDYSSETIIEPVNSNGNPVIADAETNATISPSKRKAKSKVFDDILVSKKSDIVFSLNLLNLPKEFRLKEPRTKNKKNITSGPNQKGHYEVGFGFTPSISSKIESENSALAGLINKNYQDFVANSEKASFANSLGINLQYHTPGRFFISTGLFSTTRTENVDYDYLITSFPNVVNGKIDSYPENPNPLGHIKVDYKGSNSYHFIEIPLNIGYKLPLYRNFELRSQVGVSYLGLVNRQGKKGDFTYLTLNDLKDVKLTTRNIAANIKTGLYYNRSRFVFGVEPMFGMNLNSLTNVESVAHKSKPYSYGLNLTSSIKLSKK